jgi:hypothetical protein
MPQLSLFNENKLKVQTFLMISTTKVIHVRQVISLDFV